MEGSFAHKERSDQQRGTCIRLRFIFDPSADWPLARSLEVLSLTRGPAGIRSTTGVCQRVRRRRHTNCATGPATCITLRERGEILSRDVDSSIAVAGRSAGEGSGCSSCRHSIAVQPTSKALCAAHSSGKHAHLYTSCQDAFIPNSLGTGSGTATESPRPARN